VEPESTRPLFVKDSSRSGRLEESALRIVKESVPYIVVPTLLAILSLALGPWYLSSFFLVIALFMAFFFRDPDRVTPGEPNVIVAPADGKVTLIKAIAPEEKDSPTLISIFLSPLDVHINRAPIAGKITGLTYIPGKFLMATNEKASLVNEQNVLTIEGEKITVVCKQIAGILARRVVCWKGKGDDLALGERFGMIKFSSRTDVVLPANVKIVITEGMRVRGGATVIGRIL
jgi:phosphatidylserine decarboxylase